MMTLWQRDGRQKKGLFGQADHGREIIAALDVGTHKICCLVAALEPSQGAEPASALRPRLLGFGHQRSQGITAGAVVDMKQAQIAVAAAISQAEQAAGVRIDRVIAGLNCGSPHSKTFNGHVNPASGGSAGGIVTAADIARLDTGAHAFAARGEDAVVCLNRLEFSLDGMAGIQQPAGLAGHRLEASHHAVLAARGPVKNLKLLIENCQLEVEDIAPAAYASARAVTTDAERRLGTACIDIGAGATSIAMFAEGHFVFTAVLPFGGQHITSDLSQELGLPLEEAERIKTLYGNVAATAFDEHDLVLLTRDLGGDAAQAIATRGQVSRIVRRRTEWLLAGIRACLDSCLLEPARGASIVLTGGASELVGFEGLAAAVLERPVRLAAPTRMVGATSKLAGTFSGSVPSPAFSCVMGLASIVASPSPWLSAGVTPSAPRGGYLGRVEQWLKESF